MAPRASIIAGKSVIVVQVQESIDRSLSKISTKLNRFSAGVSKIGLELFSGGLISSIATGKTISQFKEFEDRILFLSTKMRASQVEFAAITEKIRDLGRTTSFTATEVADAAVVLAQAGLNAKEVIDTLQPTLDLARGAQIELGAAGAILTNTMRSFGLATSNANEVASQFIASARLGTLDVLDLKESIKEVLGTVRTLNIDLPTTLALITQLAERSLKGTKAGTSLNTALLQLASKQKAIKESLGIIVPDNLNGGSFISFLTELNKKLDKLGNVKRVAILQSIFNIRGGRAITALDDINKIIRLQKEIRNAGDEARIAAKKMDSGFGGSIRIALSAVESLSISLGTLVGNAIKPFIDIIPAFTASMEKLAIANSSFAISLLLIPPGLAVAGASLLAFGFIGNKVAGILGLLAGAFRAITSSGISILNSGLVTLSRLLTAVSKGATKIDQKLSAAFLTPQLIARGRNAGKVKPTSFLQRVGGTRVSFAAGATTAAEFLKGFGTAFTKSSNVLPKSGALGARIGAGSIKVFKAILSPLTKANTAIRKYDTLQNRIGASGVNSRLRIEALNKSILAQHSIIGTASNKIDFYNKQFLESVKAQKVATAQSLKYEKAALGSTAVLDRQSTLQRRLNKLDADFADTIASTPTGKRTKAVKAEEAARRAKLSSIGKERAAVKAALAQSLKDNPDIESLARKSEIAKAEALNQKAYRKQIAERIRAEKNVVTAARTTAYKQAAVVRNTTARLNKLNALRPSAAKGLFGGLGNLAKGGINALGTGLKAVFSSLGKLAIGGIKLLPKLLDLSVTGVYKLWTAFKSVVGAVKSLSLVAFRTLTTLSGWGNIITVLLIIGPKIKFIREAFQRLGKGIGDAFSTIIGTFSDLSPVFDLFSNSFRSILGGEAQLGLQGIISSLSLMGEIVKSNLVIAFNQLVIAIAPFYDKVRQILGSLIEVAKLMGSIFGIAAQTAVTGVQGVTGGGAGGLFQGIIEGIKSAFSAENLKSAFEFVGGAIAEAAKIAIGVFQNIYTVIAETMLFLRDAIGGLLRSVGQTFGGVGNNISGALEFAPFKIGFLELGSALTGLSADLKANRPGAQNAVDQMNSTFRKTPGKIDTVLGKFLENLTAIFKVNTEQQATDAKNQAEADRKAAQDQAAGEAARQGASVAAGNTPFTAFGQLLAKVQTNPFGFLPKPNSSTNTPPGILGGFGGIGTVIARDFANRQKSGLSTTDQIASLEQENQLSRENIRRLRKEKSLLNTDITRDPTGTFLADLSKSNDFTKAIGLSGQELKAREEQIKALKASLVPDIPQRSTLADIASATVGSIRQTRGNLLQVAGGKSIDQQQLTALRDVVTNTGGTNETLTELSKKATPLVFQ